MGPCARIMDTGDTGVRNGDWLTMHISRVQASAADSAFAAILCNGSVVTWGNAADGGDSSDVQDQLKHVQQIEASRCTFAAVLCDGSGAWGSWW